MSATVLFGALLIFSFGFVHSQNWLTSSLSEARHSLAATSVGELVLFGGGVNSTGGASATVDIFNSTSATWTTASLAEARHALGAASARELALFGGGKNSGGPSATVDIYNSTSGGWTTASLSEARSNLAATTVGALVLFGGGVVGFRGKASARVDVFNATSGNWTTATLSQARGYLSATSVGELALFGGGAIGDGGPFFKTVDIFNLTSGAWTKATLSTARFYLAATSVGELALFGGGGIKLIGNISRVDVFNSTSGNWTTASLSTARGNLAAASIDGLALFGGGGQIGIGDATVDIFNSTSGPVWTNTTLSEARENLAAASARGFLLFGGGASGNSCFARVDIFYPQVPPVTPITQGVSSTLSNTSVQATITLSSGNISLSLPLSLKSSSKLKASSRPRCPDHWLYQCFSGFVRAPLSCGVLFVNFFLVSHSVEGETKTNIYHSDHSLQESFSFSCHSRTIGSLTVPPANIKWSIWINSAFPQGLNLSYVLSLANGNPLPSALFVDRTSNYVTTYYLDLGGDLYALLKIDELALVDNVSLPISHSLQASSSRTILVLQFPPFHSSLFYDPSIGLAELLGEGGTPSSSDEALIIGVAVGGSTLLLVLVVLVLITLVAMAKWKTQYSGRHLINFSDQRDNKL